ncbi:MAG: hypothetical protein ABL936_06450 [Aestuariivirga sp.]
MDWDLAIKRNSEVLVEIVADLFAMLGLVALTDTVSRLPWPTYRAVLRILRPAESALRRLIVVAARGLVIAPAASRPRRAGAVKTRKKGALRAACFQLFDPHQRIMLPRRRMPARPGPRIHMFNADNQLVTVWPPPRPASKPAPLPAADGMVSARRLIRRLEALESALADLPLQARRLVRWRMRQEKSENPSFKSPIRPGRPPGHRRRAVHEVDELLSECQWLASYAGMADTS